MSGDETLNAIASQVSGFDARRVAAAADAATGARRTQDVSILGLVLPTSVTWDDNGNVLCAGASREGERSRREERAIGSVCHQGRNGVVHEQDTTRWRTGPVYDGAEAQCDMCECTTFARRRTRSSCAEKAGTVKILQGWVGTPTTILLDITNQVSSFGERVVVECLYFKQPRGG